MDLKYWKEIKQAKEGGIEIKTWHDMPCFICPHCPFNSMSLNSLLGHIQDYHGPLLQKLRVTEKIVDSKGNKISY